MVDATSRQDFLSLFSETACLDPALLSGLVKWIDNLPGITSRCSYPELYFSFVLDGIAHPLLTMAINGPRADIYITPQELRLFLAHHGRFPFDADDYLDGLKPYLVKNQYAIKEYPNSDKYYLSPDAVLADSECFVNLTGQFIQDIIN